jgi:UDP-GlcNAc:undecaprenyl-phosphate GlcNAc-1-phosphate transferase
MILNLFAYLFFATVTALALIQPSIWLSRRWGLIDDPSTAAHKIHHSPIPQAGGLALFSTLVLGNLLAGTLRDAEILPILGSAAIIFGFGLWDDRKGLSAPWKFLGQILAVSILIANGVQVNFTGHQILNIAVTVFWVVGITNAFNLVDSKDGLALGLAILAAAFFTVVTHDAGQIFLARSNTVLLGACLAVFYFNAAPARLFLGDSGAQLLGFLLASLAIAYTPPGLPQGSSWFVPILLLGVPIFDTTLVTVSRLRRGINVFQGKRDHTYHRLVSLGVEPARAVLTMHLSAGLLSCLAFIALTLPPLWANLVFALCLLTGLVTLLWLERRNPYQEDRREY